MSRLTFRVLLAIALAILAAGGVGASPLSPRRLDGACRAGSMTFQQGPRKFEVQSVSYYARGAAERVVFLGSVSGKPYVFDVQTAPGSSPSGFLSLVGTKADRGGMPVRWGGQPVGYQSGSVLPIVMGPLLGEWLAICQG